MLRIGNRLVRPSEGRPRRVNQRRAFTCMIQVFPIVCSDNAHIEPEMGQLGLLETQATDVAAVVYEVGMVHRQLWRDPRLRLNGDELRSARRQDMLHAKRQRE